ncbi:IPT/TIG domain-containing protein, partial [Streptomyces sp. NPDC020801]|uniref:IPT/TIG domain-containing protein n=1 Tax=Streptomyces sp. NPDC020801 TaxID=3365093 RepID=UPI0037B01D11
TAAASFTVVSATQITAVTPPGAAGSVQVTVTTAGGTSNGLPYTYVPSPTLSGLVPVQGPVSGGTTVTLTGTNLTAATAVKFGATAAASFTVVSASQITAVSPPGAAGPVQVTVTSPGGTSGGLSHFYVSAPTLASAAPVQGPVSGGTTVTLTGTNLTGATAVKFGATAAASFTVVFSTQITAVSPPGAAGSVQVSVTTLGGTSNSLPYFFLNPPTLTSAGPSQGPLSAGTAVALTGTNLTAATAVKFGATAAASFTVVSDTQVTATAPAGGAGPVQVTVTTPGGTSNSLPYTYVPSPTLTSAGPSQGPLSAGTAVTLTGTNLTTTTAVTFGTMEAASFTVVSDTQVTATAPAGSAGPVQVTVTTSGGASNSLTYTRIQSP